MAEFEGTVQLTGLVTPINTTDSYAVSDPLYGIDGLRSVSTLAQRDAIALPRRRVGMLVYVAETDGYYKLTDQPSPDEWVEFTSNSETIVKAVDRAITSYFDVEETGGVFEDKRYLVLESANIGDWLTPPTPAVNNIIEYIDNQGFIETEFQDGAIVVEKETLVIYSYINGTWAKLTANVQVENISDGTAQPTYVGENGETKQFVGIKAVPGEGVTVEYDSVSEAIALGLNSSNIDHDNLFNYEVNQHVDHTQVSIIPGPGLTGGGTIDSDIIINLTRINPEAATPDPAARVYDFPKITVGEDGRINSIEEDPQDAASTIAPFIDLEDLRNTNIVTPGNFDVIRYDTAESEWSTWPMPPKLTTSNVTLNGAAAGPLSREGDLHVNQSNGDLSKVVGGTWTVVGSLQGPPGGGTQGVGIDQITLLNSNLFIEYTDGTSDIVGPVVGAAGPQGPQGPEGDTGAVGPVGPGYADATISPSGNLILTTTTGQQETVGTVVGPAGPQGPQGTIGPQGTRGSTWSVGAGAPNVIGSEISGDLFLDETTGDVYQFNGAIWAPLTNIRGPQGDSITVTVNANAPTLPNIGDVWIQP